MKILQKLRSGMYRNARILGDVNAVLSARPDKIAKRILRKKSGRSFGRILRGVLK